MLTVSMALAGALVIALPAATGSPYKRPNTPPADPEHLVTVPNSTALNPGSGDYAVDFRMRTTHSFGNVIQKGQAGSPGGYWKFQQPSGKIACLFRGSAGSSTASAGSTVRVNDGNWHTVRCERTASMVTMIIDGVVTGRNRSGDIDYVRIETS